MPRGVRRYSRRAGRGREALPDGWETPEGREGPPIGQTGSECPPGGLGGPPERLVEVGSPSQGVRRGWEALPVGWEGSGGHH